MTTTVKNFATPESIVRISNLKVNIKDFTFQLTLGTKAKKQRNFREEVITGKITVELNDWLSKTFKERIKVAEDSEQGYKYQETGNLTTGFKTFLSKIGKEFKPGILSEMVFESDNKSESYQDNPFKIIKYANGHCTFTLVNIGTKRVVTTEDPMTGEVTQHWKQKFVKLGERVVPEFFNKKNYIRLKVEQFIQATQYQEPTTATA